MARPAGEVALDLLGEPSAHGVKLFGRLAIRVAFLGQDR